MMMEDHVAVEEDPSLSSAAHCITFRFLGRYCFRPEFTHQCFPGEWIRGYLPVPAALENIKGKQHSSFRNHEDEESSSHHLSVEISLAPSCRTCMVSTLVSKRKRVICTRQSPLQNNKRARLDNDDNGNENENTINTTTSSSCNEEEDAAEEEEESSYQNSSSSSVSDEAAAAEGSTRQRSMPVEEIVEKVSKGLPPRVVRDNHDSKDIHDDYLSEPVGTVVKEYQRTVNGVDTDFCLCLATGDHPVVADYHHCIQNLALWFIETADCVNVENRDGGYWKVLYLFCKSKTQKSDHQQEQYNYSLAGYVTLFFFSSPFKKPKPGLVGRICQALVLPPYQRMGHGKAMLETIYEICQEDEAVVEINVEDPAPAFVALRNRVDYQALCRACSNKQQPWIPSLQVSLTGADEENDFFKPLSDADATRAGVVAKLTPRQVQVAFEMYKLEMMQGNELFLRSELGELERSKKQEYETNFRFMVKKRLVKVHREDLGAFNTKQDKQDYLSKVYRETLAQYRAILKLKKE